MKLSIIIVNYNHGNELKECIDSISGNHEVIVIDNNSQDNSLELIKNKKIKLIRNKKNIGFAKAVNQAIKKSKGKNILLLNPDTILKKDTISKTLDFLEKNKNAKIVGCKILNPDNSLQYSCRRFPSIIMLLCRRTPLGLFLKSPINKYLMKEFNHKEIKKVDWVSGAFLMMKNKNLLDDKFFLYFEDTDICKKVGNVYYYPDAEVIHKKEVGSSKNIKLATHHIKSLLYYFWKHL